MSIKKIIRRFLFQSSNGMLLFSRFRQLREKRALRISDYEFIKKLYRERYGKDIDLNSPKGFGEKLQWLKLFYRDEWVPVCSDKYEVRNYLKQFGYEHLANKVIGVYEDAGEIPFDELPKKFVAKATHGSGWNLICEDKDGLKWDDSVKLMNSWLRLNLFVFGREWNYKDIKPRIIVEEYIDHEPLNDYKLMCFNGEPLYVQLNNDFEGKHYVDFYDIKNWEHLDLTYTNFHRSDRLIEKPAKLDDMIEIARVLSKRFPFVRMDFYQFDETVILGEMTFFPSSGMWPFIPEENGYSELMGKALILPKPNYNLELYERIMQGENKTTEHN